MKNSHVSPFEGRGFRALGPIKKGDIYLKVRNVQILIFSGSVLTCYVLNFAGSLYHMLVSGQSKGCLQGRCFSLPQKLTDEHKQYVHCILVWNASPPFTILTKSKSQLDNSRIVKTLQLSLFGFLSNFSNWPKKMSKHLGVFFLMFFSVSCGIFSLKNNPPGASTVKWRRENLGIVEWRSHGIASFSWSAPKVMQVGGTGGTPTSFGLADVVFHCSLLERLWYFFWWNKNPANKLRLVVYLIWSLIHPKGGWPWDFWIIKQ